MLWLASLSRAVCKSAKQKRSKTIKPEERGRAGEIACSVDDAPGDDLRAALTCTPRKRFITCVIARRARRLVTREEAGIEDAGFKSLRERYTEWAAVVLGLAYKFLPYVCIVRGEARRTF